MTVVVVSSTVFTHERQWQELTVAELVGLQAQLASDVPALVMSEATLTYRQLEERANRLAHVLQQYGVGPEVVVVLALERGTETLDYYVALLAIWKAGGAFLTLDLTALADSRRWVVAEGQARLLLTTAWHARACPKHVSRRFVWRPCSTN